MIKNQKMEVGARYRFTNQHNYFVDVVVTGKCKYKDTFSGVVVDTNSTETWALFTLYKNWSKSILTNIRTWELVKESSFSTLNKKYI